MGELVTRNRTTILGVNYGRGQRFDASVLEEIPRRRRAMLIEGPVPMFREPEQEEGKHACQQCGAVFVSAMYLRLHGEEEHNPESDVQQAREAEAAMSAAEDARRDAYSALKAKLEALQPEVMAVRRLYVQTAHEDALRRLQSDIAALFFGELKDYQ